MSRLSRLNSAILALIITINLYIVVAPFAPKVWFWWQKNHGQTAAALTEKIVARPTDETSSENRIIIPAMLLDQPIREGRDTYAILSRGVWRWPDGSTPDRGGNTTLIGHRFTYTNPRGVFYFLDKIRVGDRLGVVWKGKTYQYKTTNIKVVPPTETSILRQTAEPTLTLYTCTPLWNPKERLVVTAHLEHIL